MTCTFFDQIAPDVARGEDLDPAVRDEALAHARGCLRCALRLEDERAVSGALGALRERTALAEAPVRIEWTLRRALRDADGAVAGRGRRGFVHAVEIALVAAAAALAAVVLIPRGVAPAHETARPAAAPVASTAPAASTAAESEFVSLGYGEDLRELDSLQVVQVEMPRTALAALGWPGLDLQGAPLTAEVIVGHDGVARAIRLLD